MNHSPSPAPAFDAHDLPHQAPQARPSHQAHGCHVLADLHGVAPALLSDAQLIARVLRDSAEAAGAHILFTHFHHFGDKLGVTGVLLLAESHISIHTWPEYGFAAFDIFMCGQAEPERALAVLRDAFAPVREQVRRVLRGETPPSPVR